MDNPIQPELLQTYLDGRATPLQKQLIRTWLLDPANQEIFYAQLQRREQQQPQLVVDDTEAYARFVTQLAQTAEAQPATPVRVRRWPRLFMGVAASLGLAGLAGLLTLTEPYWNTRTIATEYGEIRSVVLPDGSRVTLNANSALQLPRFGFGRSTRQVSLRGEAEFAVVHTPDAQRFVVTGADGVEVVVLGTEFVMNTRRGTRVVLNRGKVQLRYGRQQRPQTLTMLPGEWVRVRPGTALQRGRSADPVPTEPAWKLFRYDFRQTPLPEVAQLMEDNFGLRVTLAPELADRKLSGQFHARTADDILTALTELFDVRVTQTEKAVRIEPAFADNDSTE
ncbi:DUF4974 domain-containing protein [Rudanella paleaurantiibacter]|uniref:DUF4974 domain-containing protein n=1 Tax=Rudanella paleaurantiibacter TaxID=2614655 RepID=A0A7J5TUN1_9BACT|nr:FecR domain-containing protein [Rudanella paleaurantiibacter]KAB7727613.1 DUF4974 domain-containing protein [Rudanella paleaurantiibacter]